MYLDRFCSERIKLLMMMMMMLMTSASSPPAHLTVITVGPLTASTAVQTLSCTSLLLCRSVFTSPISCSVVESLDFEIAITPVTSCSKDDMLSTVAEQTNHFPCVSIQLLIYCFFYQFGFPGRVNQKHLNYIFFFLPLVLFIL